MDHINKLVEKDWTKGFKYLVILCCVAFVIYLPSKYVITVLYENFFKSDVEKYIDGDFEGYLRKDIVAAQIKAVQEGKTPYPEDFIWALTPETAQTDVEKEFVQMSSEEVAKEWIAYLYEGKKGTIFEENPVADWANHYIFGSNTCITDNKEKFNTKKWELVKMQQDFIDSTLQALKESKNLEKEWEFKRSDSTLHSEEYALITNNTTSKILVGELLTCKKLSTGVSRITMSSYDVKNNFTIVDLNELGIIKE